MKRNGFRTVVVLALTIFLLNAPVCATAPRLQDTCAEAGDEAALRPEWMRILHDTLPICKISIPGSHDSGSIKGGHMLKTQATDIPAQLQQGIRALISVWKRRIINWGVSQPCLSGYILGR